MPIMVNFADIVEPNGKTIRENNLALIHTIPLGTLIELRVDVDEYDDYTGVRMYVVRHGRDCDGEPLYTLAANKHEDQPYHMIGGWSKESFVVVPAPERSPHDERARPG